MCTAPLATEAIIPVQGLLTQATTSWLPGPEHYQLNDGAACVEDHGDITQPIHRLLWSPSAAATIVLLSGAGW